MDVPAAILYAHPVAGHLDIRLCMSLRMTRLNNRGRQRGCNHQLSSHVTSTAIDVRQ
jgi:hypothetical protein